MERADPPLDELYREVVLDHHRHPRGRAALPRVDSDARGLNPVCGDDVEVRLALGDHVVSGVQVTGRGCAICTASGSMLAELVPGRSLDEVGRLTRAFRALLHGEEPAADLDLGDLPALEGVRRFAVRVKCAMLPWVTLEEAARAWTAGEKPGTASTEGGTT